MPDDRVVIITGATGGLGREMARRFGRSGCRIAIHYHKNKETAEKLSKELGGMGSETLAVQADVQSLAETRSMTEEVLRRWNRIDVMVANAGIRRDALLLRMTGEAWDSTLRVNLSGVRNTILAVGDHFLHQEKGHVIAIGSIAGLQGRAGQANYAAAKAGMIGLIRSVAAEWGPQNIQLNLVLPGLQTTGMTDRLSGKQLDALAGPRLLSHPSPIHDVAEFVYTLSRLTGISGQIFNLDSRIF